MYDILFDDNDMFTLQNMLKNNNKTITAAESCTGGLISSMITEISGSSNIFRGAVITYCNEIKEQELGVKKETMIKYGVVSKETVSQMLDGVAKKFDADYAIAVSGVAGPTGGTKDKPVGMVVVGVVDRQNNAKNVEIYQFDGDRKSIQIQAAKTGLKKVLKILQKTLDNK